jgi:hypothetical protein
VFGWAVAVKNLICVWLGIWLTKLLWAVKREKLKFYKVLGSLEKY